MSNQKEWLTEIDSKLSGDIQRYWLFRTKTTFVHLASDFRELNRKLVVPS